MNTDKRMRDRISSEQKGTENRKELREKRPSSDVNSEHSLGIRLKTINPPLLHFIASRCKTGERERKRHKERCNSIKAEIKCRDI